MSIKLCITQNNQGQGGVAGGAGNLGQTSQQATGAAARSYGVPVISITTGMTATFTVQLTNDIGGLAPSDLTDIQTIKFVAKPTMTAACTQLQVPCTKVLQQGQSTGQITFTLTPQHVNQRQGIHYAAVLCYTADNKLTKTYRCYLQIRKGMTGAKQNGVYPVTIAAVRMAIMDTSAQANKAIDDLQFSDMQIAQCIQNAVDQWNQTPPQTSANFTVATFPYRRALIRGAVGNLLSMVLYRYARNRMVYSNAGVSLDDSDKLSSYQGLASQAKQQWRVFVATKKTQLNMQQCFGIISQPWFDGGIYGDRDERTI